MTTRRLAAFATGKPADGLRADGAPGLHDSLPAPCVAGQEVHPRSKNLTEVVRESTNDIRRVTPVGASGDEPSLSRSMGTGGPSG